MTRTSVTGLDSGGDVAVCDVTWLLAAVSDLWLGRATVWTFRRSTGVALHIKPFALFPRHLPQQYLFLPGVTLISGTHWVSTVCVDAWWDEHLLQPACLKEVLYKFDLIKAQIKADNKMNVCAVAWSLPEPAELELPMIMNNSRWWNVGICRSDEPRMMTIENSSDGGSSKHSWH